MTLLFIISLIHILFFSGSHIAFLQLKSRHVALPMEALAAKNSITKILFTLPQLVSATLTIGFWLSLTTFGISATYLSTALLQNWSIGGILIIFIQIITFSILALIAAEFVPRILFRLYPSKLFNSTSLLLWFYLVLLYPLSILIVGMSKMYSSSVKSKRKPSQLVHALLSKTDAGDLKPLRPGVSTTSPEIPMEIQIMRNALDFSSIRIRECTMPRTELVSAELDEPVDTVRQRAIKSGYSKIIIYKNSIDNIIGYVQVKQLFRQPANLKNILTPIPVVPEAMTANKVLAIFNRQHKSIAVVVDEFGGTAGIVTMEDILEEIFGEIIDEHDYLSLPEKKLSEKEYLFSGRLEIDYLNEKYQLNLPVTDEYETLAGMILYHLESIPKENQVVEIGDFKLTILSAANNRINLLKLNLP